MNGHTSGHAAGSQRRFAIRTFLAAALVLSVVGAASAGASGPQPADPGAGMAQAAPQVDPAAQRRAEAAYQRVDRRYREAAESAAEQAADDSVDSTSEAPLRLAAEPQRQPPPPPPPPAPAAPSAPESSGGSAGPVPASCSEYSGNRATGCTLLLESGFDLAQMSCLDSLWSRESGWNHLAENPSSGAYGIPQALPGSKMATSGDDWRTNPVTQINWGLGYIQGRYGTPCAAWNHSQANGWY